MSIYFPLAFEINFLQEHIIVILHSLVNSAKKIHIFTLGAEVQMKKQINKSNVNST